MVQICALASGSNGNCYYIGNEEEAVLVDIGISNRQLQKRLHESKLSVKKIKAVFISHEHTDHIRGLKGITERNEIQGFATQKTFENTNFQYRSDKINFFNPGDTLNIGSIKVHSFTKNHDAIDPVSFRIEIENLHIAVITDLGIACEEVKKQLRLCHAAFLESNYENDLLIQGRYPEFLKKRVLSDKGHLSNHQAFELVNSLAESPLHTVLLSHISQDNNRIELAMNKFIPLAHSHNILPTSRHQASEVVFLS